MGFLPLRVCSTVWHKHTHMMAKGTHGYPEHWHQTTGGYTHTHTENSIMLHPSECKNVCYLLFSSIICVWIVWLSACLINGCCDQQEDDSDCGGGTSLSPSLWPMLGLQLLLLWLLTGPRHSWPLHTHTSHLNQTVFYIGLFSDTPSSERNHWCVNSLPVWKRSHSPVLQSFSNAKGCSLPSVTSLLHHVSIAWDILFYSMVQQ